MLFDPEQALLDQEAALTSELAKTLDWVRNATTQQAMYWVPDPAPGLPGTYHGLLPAAANRVTKLVTVSPTCLWIFQKRNAKLGDTFKWNEVLHLVSSKEGDAADTMIDIILPAVIIAAKSNEAQRVAALSGLAAIRRHAKSLVGNEEEEDDKEATISESLAVFDDQVQDQVGELEAELPCEDETREARQRAAAMSDDAVKGRRPGQAAAMPGVLPDLLLQGAVDEVEELEAEELGAQLAGDPQDDGIPPGEPELLSLIPSESSSNPSNRVATRMGLLSPQALPKSFHPAPPRKRSKKPSEKAEAVTPKKPRRKRRKKLREAKTRAPVEGTKPLTTPPE